MTFQDIATTLLLAIGVAGFAITSAGLADQRRRLRSNPFPRPGDPGGLSCHSGGGGAA